MNRISLVRNQQKIEDLFKKIGQSTSDPELLSHWAKYLCIIVSAYIESSIRTIYCQYAKDKAEPKVARYVERSLNNFQNPNMAKILDITGSFDPRWRESLENLSIGELKEAIDSIVANRHLIAHGKNSDITLIRMKEFYQRAFKVIELIDMQCNQQIIS